MDDGTGVRKAGGKEWVEEGVGGEHWYRRQSGGDQDGGVSTVPVVLRPWILIKVSKPTMYMSTIFVDTPTERFTLTTKYPFVCKLKVSITEYQTVSQHG